MSDSNVARRFEIRAVRPLWLTTIAAAVTTGLTQHWWSFLVSAVALFLFGMIGASLHPSQSHTDLVRGPITGPIGDTNSRLHPKPLSACWSVGGAYMSRPCWPVCCFGTHSHSYTGVGSLPCRSPTCSPYRPGQR